MVTFLTQARHQYTLEPVLPDLPRARLMSYDRLFRTRKVPAATYVFTDLDRLSAWELELAGRYHAAMRNAGWRVLNDPASVKQRFALLRCLHAEGINQFNVYRPSAGEWPVRYPVFVRRDAFHDGALTDLIDDRGTLEGELVSLRGRGIPESNTMVVEYAAEPARDDIFLKHALFRVGDRYFPDCSVSQRTWEVKYGEKGCLTEAEFIEAKERMKTVPFEDLMKRVFELAGIEYGRMDFGLLQDQPQIYEINTNPTVRFSVEHHSEHRVEAKRIVAENFKAAVDALQTGLQATGKLRIKDGILRHQIAREKYGQRSRPTL